MAGAFTVDASVFLNAFNEHEAGHADSRRVLEALRAKSLPIVVPTLILPEVAATVARGGGDVALATEFATALGRLPHLVLVALDAPLARQSARVAAQQRLRGSDAVYAAVALRFGSTLVTLDREQRRRTAPLVKARSPKEALREIERT